MDQGSFDRLARLLGEASDRRAGLKAAFGALLGAGGAVAALQADADAKKGRGGNPSSPDAGKRKHRKKTCKPACGSGYECVKEGKQRVCVCPTGATCGAACCRIGQVCEGGACVPEPEPVECIPAGEPCKGVGRRCCDGRVCASGQGGLDDVACYSPKTGDCTTATDCVYGMACVSGRCAPPAPAGLGDACDAASQQLCTTPGAVCTAYDGAGAPSGTYCTLPLGTACTGDPECTCYKCFLVAPGATGARVRRESRAAARYACCGPQGFACSSDRNCCLGTTCVNGTCQASRSCTINRIDYDSDEAAGAALKALVESGTVSPITVGPGTYKPVPAAGQTSALVVDRNVTLEACFPEYRPTLDGGATVTGPEDVNAKDLTWGGGSRIMLVESGRTVVVDGINFQNGNASTDSSSQNGGAVRNRGTLTLRNLDISRCNAFRPEGGGSGAGDGGGVYAFGATGLTLTDVNLRQNRAKSGGAVYSSGTPVSIAGSSGRKALMHHNYGTDRNGAAYCEGSTTCTFNQLDVRYNVVNPASSQETGGIGVFDSAGTLIATISDVDLIDNAAPWVGAMKLSVGNVGGSPTGKATLTNVRIKNNTATNAAGGYAGGLYNSGKLEFGVGVEISGNKALIGSGVFNQTVTANVTCTAQDVSLNTSLTGTPAANGQTYADCYGGNRDSNMPTNAANKMPQACCATHNPTW